MGERSCRRIVLATSPWSSIVASASLVASRPDGSLEVNRDVRSWGGVAVHRHSIRPAAPSVSGAGLRRSIAGIDGDPSRSDGRRPAASNSPSCSTSGRSGRLDAQRRTSTTTGRADRDPSGIPGLDRRRVTDGRAARCDRGSWSMATSFGMIRATPIIDGGDRPTPAIRLDDAEIVDARRADIGGPALAGPSTRPRSAGRRPIDGLARRSGRWPDRLEIESIAYGREPHRAIGILVSRRSGVRDLRRSINAAASRPSSLVDDAHAGSDASDCRLDRDSID